MTEQTQCIMCKSTSLTTLWHTSKRIAQGCYPVPKDHPCPDMPFNITMCRNCKTHQLKYFGDPAIIYDYQANFYGSIRTTMNDLFAKFVTANPNIRSLLEIGAGSGALAEAIQAYHPNPTLSSYTIVDPTYSGPEETVQVHRCFFEAFPLDQLNKIDTLVMSHVFEHFFNPTAILERIKRSSIQTIYLNFPDLEAYIKEDNYHVLNPEHIYYIENDFLINLFAYYGFILKQRYNHEKHSVFLEFHRSTQKPPPFPENKTAEADVKAFFRRIEEKIENLATIQDTPLYIWPASMHTLYLQACGFPIERVTAIADNAPHKIGKYLYGTQKEIVPLKSIPSNATIIMNGGCYNKEITRK